MTAAAWPWVLGGVAFILVVGLAFAVLLGLAGMPGDFLRRARQTGAAKPSERGQEMPDEVPAASAEETARLADDDRPS
ncbi:MAG TPA: hypothetical protein VLB89_09955 [Gaiellaceae bacterium]|nr:hypothetical protein [Gaiellaceae bacterium]